MLKKYVVFYTISLLIISFLLLLFLKKMDSTYEAKANFIIFNKISDSFQQNKKSNHDISINPTHDIHVQYDSKNLNISIRDIDYRSCLKYGVDYIDSKFKSLRVNDFLFTRKDVITRDLILEKCNKTSNNIMLIQTMEK